MSWHGIHQTFHADQLELDVQRMKGTKLCMAHESVGVVPAQIQLAPLLSLVPKGVSPVRSGQFSQLLKPCLIPTSLHDPEDAENILLLNLMWKSDSDCTLHATLPKNLLDAKLFR